MRCTKARFAGFVLCALLVAPAARADSRIVGVSLSGAAASQRTLTLELDAPPSAFGVTTSGKGVEVRLDATSLAAAAPPEIVVSSHDGLAALLVPSAGAVVREVRVSGKTLRVSLVEPTSGASSSYRIGVGDVLYIAVYKNQDLTGEVTVSPEGTVTLPLVSEVPAAGSTETELAQRLTQILGKDLLVDPQVSVTVRTYQSQFVYVTGAVSQSRRVALRPGLTMTGILAEAGVALAPGQVAVLKRGASVAGAPPITLGSDELESEAAPTPRDGDVIVVHERDSVLLAGEFRRGGKLPIDPGTTLLQAVALSEGLTEWANRSEIRILRKSNGPLQEIRANLKRIESRKDPDVPLAPGDVILVKRRSL